MNTKKIHTPLQAVLRSVLCLLIIAGIFSPLTAYAADTSETNETEIAAVIEETDQTDGEKSSMTDETEVPEETDAAVETAETLDALEADSVETKISTETMEETEASEETETSAESTEETEAAEETETSAESTEETEAAGETEVSTETMDGAEAEEEPSEVTSDEIEPSVEPKTATAAAAVKKTTYTVAVQSSNSTYADVDVQGAGAYYGAALACIAAQEYASYGDTACGSRYWGDRGPEAWCCDFVYWCANELGLVGAELPFGNWTAYCPAAVWQLANAGAELYYPTEETVPQPGDIIFFSDTYGRPGQEGDEIMMEVTHIGIVIAGTEETVTVIEGNASNQLKENTYALTEAAWGSTYILAFARPSYPCLFSAEDQGQIHSGLLETLYGGGGSVTCDFDGYKTIAGRHEGIDFCKGAGTAVYSVVDGEIIRITSGGNGSLSTICIYDETNDKTVVYLHTVPSSDLYVGQEICHGEFLGWEAARGATAAHTHIEVVEGKSYAANRSVNDPVLDNTNPYPYWAVVLDHNMAEDLLSVAQSEDGEWEITSYSSEDGY